MSDAINTGPREWDVRVFNTGGDDDFIVDGSDSGTAVLECRRCLTEVEVDVQTEFVYPMLYRPSDLPMTLDELDDDEEERLVFGNPQVDFAPLVTQLFAIEVPLTALCKPDCLGLDEDGVNLNEHPERAPAAAAARSVSSPPSPFADLPTRPTLKNAVSPKRRLPLSNSTATNPGFGS